MDFITVYKRISPALKKIANSYNGWCRYIDADDLYQEMCIYMWHTYANGVPADLNDAYVIKGCKFHILNYLRKNRSNVITVSLQEEINDCGGSREDIVPEQNEPLQRHLEGRLTFDEIRNNGFSKREKEILEYLLSGLTVRAIGAKLGISHVMVIKYKKSIINKWRKKHPGYQGG